MRHVSGSSREDGYESDGRITRQLTTIVLGECHFGTRTLTSARRSPQLQGQFDNLRDTCRPDRMTT